MKKIIIFIILFTIPFSTSANTFITKTIDGKKVEVIKYSTSSEFYDIKIGATNDATNLKDIMLQNNAISGVNGVFECPKDYTACGGKSYTINERYVQGEKIATYKSTGDRVVFGWDKNITPFLFQTDKINADKEGKIYEGFANFPLLLQEGRLMTEYYYEVNLIDKKMLSKQARNFICSDKKKENIFFGYIHGVTLDEAGIALLDLGCYNALNLDAGYSKAFIYNMQYLKGPGRDILDGVFIVPKNIDFPERKKKLKTRVNNILKKLNNFPLKRRIKKIEALISNLDDIYSKIHKKQTKEIFEIIDGEKVKIGEETSFNNKELIKSIYTINMLRFYLYEVNKIFKSIEEINKYKLDYKVNINF